MIRTSDGPVNLTCVRLHRATYELPVDVAAGFEQMACGSGSHTRTWHDIEALSRSTSQGQTGLLQEGLEMRGLLFGGSGTGVWLNTRTTPSAAVY